VLANKGALVGDRLLFTKALGTGVISTAIKKGVAEQAWIDAAVRSMTTLNKAAAEVIRDNREQRNGSARPAEIRSAAQAGASGPTWAVHALTDITGFGLIGHAREVALASDVSLIFHAARIPALEGAMDCIHAGYIPGGLKANREFAECAVDYNPSVPDDVRTLLFDPQTAGGLLISVSAGDAERLLSALREAGVPAVEIGEVIARTKPLIRITA